MKWQTKWVSKGDTNSKKYADSNKQNKESKCLWFVDPASMYNLVNNTKFVHNFILSIFINLYMFRATIGPSSGETTVFVRHLVLVILYG